MMRIIKKYRPGLTLIELVLAIAIIGMIIISFMPLFVMSAKNNNKSENILSATYIGKDAMELAYHLSNDEKVIYNGLKSEHDPKVYKTLSTRLAEEGYRQLSDNTYAIESSDQKYITIEFTEKGKLMNVLVKVYKEPGTLENQLEAQYESLYFWKEK